MTMINIDTSLCKKDGFCTQACPLLIIKQKDKESHPEMVARGEKICIQCGHCVAVCPHGALNHSKVPIESCLPILKENKITPDQAVQFLRSRRSIRQFKDKPVEKEQIKDLIDIARYAPTGSNSQNITWTVFTNKDQLREISSLAIEWMRKNLKEGKTSIMPPYISLLVAGWDNGIDVILRDAPSLIIASSPSEINIGLVNLSIALTYLELIAASKGLGTCWIGLLQNALLHSKPLKEFVGLPKTHLSHYPMVLGYSKFRYHRMPERKQSEIVWKD